MQLNSQRTRHYGSPWTSTYSGSAEYGQSVSLRTCLHGGGGPQVGEVKYGGSPHLSCKRDEMKMRDYMDKRVTPPKRVTSPTWGPPPPCKQVLIRKSATLHVHLIVLSTFLCHHCTTSTWKCLTSHIEDVSKRKRTFFFYEFACIWQNKRLVIIAKKRWKSENLLFIKKRRFYRYSHRGTLNLRHWRVAGKYFRLTYKTLP